MKLLKQIILVVVFTLCIHNAKAQIVLFDTNDSILQVALGAFEKVLQLEKEIEELGIELEKTGDEKTLHEAKIILSDDIALNAYGILAMTANIGLFVKSKKSLKGFCLENGLFKLSEELMRLERVVGL